MVSIDVEDCFYSIPHEGLIQAVQQCIDVNDLVDFQKSTDISLKQFLDLRLYVNKTFITFGRNTFLQKSGICIGSSAAPVSSDSYLAVCDCSIAERLNGEVLKIFRYVDEQLVMFIYKQGETFWT